MIKEAYEGPRQKVIKKLGATYLMKKSKCSSSNKITFEKVFQEVLHRKDNEFYCIDSPQLNQQLQEFTGNLPDKYRTALSTPSSATVAALERKKYINIKGRIQKAMGGLAVKMPSSLKDAFMEKQAILTDFLNELANEMERECRQKADILKYLWNSMVEMLENVAGKLTQKIKYREKKDVEQSLKSHQQYQQLIDGYRQKQEQLSEKSHVQRMTIDSLIYELRFKRKEVNKLYRNQKLLINKLNDFKIENLNIQNNYLDLLSSQDFPLSQSTAILQAKDQVRKNMYSKFAISGSKKQNKKEIGEQLGLRETKIQDLQSLYDEIKSIAGSKLGSPHLVSNLIGASIDNFGLKYDDKFTNQSKILSVPQKIARLNAETQTHHNFAKNNQQQKMCASTQFGYYDKLTEQLINNKGTQSYCQYPRKVQTNVYQTQVNRLQLLSYGKVKEGNIIRTFNQTVFGIRQFKANNFIKVNGITPKNHKKNYSELQGNSSIISEFPQNNFIEDCIQQNQLQKSDSQMIQQYDIKKRKPLKRNSIKFIRQRNSINISPTNSKQRYSSLTSKQGISRLNDDDIKPKKSNFAPEPIENEQSSPQIKITIINRASSGSKPERLSRDSSKKSMTQKFQRPNEHEDISKNGFLQKNNYFNIVIDAQKEAAIFKMFFNKQYSTIGFDDMQDIINQSDSQDAKTHQKSSSNQLQGLLAKQQTYNNAGFKRLSKRKQTNLQYIQARQKSKRYSQTSKYKDENDMILNLCRSNYQKGHKNKKQKIGIFKYQDQFTSVKDKIQFIARDVKELVINKENMLKKTVNNKNIKSAYKILMMTFSKAYDAYNKGILRGNLIYPLYQSFALIYGAINNNQIYKKMINFVAALCVNKENTILRFFLFFLGLDSSSKYSQKVTISEVYLCLKLLQKISVDGKVTLNIESICTDTTKIKDQLMVILKQQNIPELLSQSIQIRVTKQLQSSSLYQNSTSQSHLKLNIYNIILLIIQQVIKCKNTLKQNLIPIFMKYQIYQKEMKLPVTLIEVILSGWKSPNYDPNKLKALIKIITVNGKRETVTIQQFCSILFESNLINIDQLFLKSDFIFRKNWKIPLNYLQEIQYKKVNKKYESEIQKREIQLFFHISSPNNRGQFVQQNGTIQKMKRIIFERHYERKITEISQNILGDLLICCNQKENFTSIK